MFKLERTLICRGDPGKVSCLYRRDADEMMRNDVRLDFSSHGFRRLALQVVHAKSRFDVAQIERRLPAANMEISRVIRRLSFGLGPRRQYVELLRPRTGWFQTHRHERNQSFVG